jgi:hypothetical protein
MEMETKLMEKENNHTICLTEMRCLNCKKGYYGITNKKIEKD